MTSSRISNIPDPNAEKPWLQYYPEWTDHSLEYGGMTLSQLYDANLVKNADQPATRFFGRVQTYSELDREVRRAAAGLKAFGVRPGDRVAIMLPNCPQHVAAYYAVQKLGGVVVEHNPLYTANELRPQFRDHGARIAIVWDKTADTLEKLRADPALLGNAVDEFIRWSSPVKHFFRTAACDAEVAGVAIKAGDGLVMAYPSANRDETVFDDPFAFRVDRPNAREHLAFGYGPHLCLGQHLAKLEIRTLFEELLARFTDFELAGEPAWTRSSFVSGMKRMPIRYRAR